MTTTRIYDGALWCDKCDKCPVVDYNVADQSVLIFDPHKPENGKMKMSVDEYNALIKNAKPIA